MFLRLRSPKYYNGFEPFSLPFRGSTLSHNANSTHTRERMVDFAFCCFRASTALKTQQLGRYYWNRTSPIHPYEGGAQTIYAKYPL